MIPITLDKICSFILYFNYFKLKAGFLSLKDIWDFFCIKKVNFKGKILSMVHFLTSSMTGKNKNVARVFPYFLSN